MNNNQSCILEGVEQIIADSKVRQSSYVNKSLTLLYWDLGAFLHQYLLLNGANLYGSKAMRSLSRQLVVMYGRSFSLSNLYRMVLFRRVFYNKQIVVTLSPKINWSHFTTLITIKSRSERAHLILEIIEEHLSVRKLRDRIKTANFEFAEELDLSPAMIDYLEPLDRVGADCTINEYLLNEIKICVMKLRSRIGWFRPDRLIMNQIEMTDWIAFKLKTNLRESWRYD